MKKSFRHLSVIVADDHGNVVVRFIRGVARREPDHKGPGPDGPAPASPRHGTRPRPVNIDCPDSVHTGEVTPA